MNKKQQQRHKQVRQTSERAAHSSLKEKEAPINQFTPPPAKRPTDSTGTPSGPGYRTPCTPEKAAPHKQAAVVDLSTREAISTTLHLNVRVVFPYLKHASENNILGRIS